MNEGEKDDPLKELGERLDRARQRLRPEPERPTSGNAIGSALAFAWRVGVELVGAIVVAVFLGWVMDRWLGTRPWGMIGFFFLGVAAGLLNVYRAVSGLGMSVGYRRSPNKGAAPQDGTGKDEDED
jgi:ATP synthase protein I